jgi:hypothetical protein
VVEVGSIVGTWLVVGVGSKVGIRLMVRGRCTVGVTSVGAELVWRGVFIVGTMREGLEGR